MGLARVNRDTSQRFESPIGVGDIYSGSLELFRMQDKSTSENTMINPRIGKQVSKAYQLAPELFEPQYGERLHPAMSVAQQTQDLASESAVFNNRSDIYFNQFDELKQRFPNAGFMSMDEIYRDAGQEILTKGQAQAKRQEHATPMARTLGALTGTLRGAMEDPINILSMLIFRTPAATLTRKMAFTGGVVMASETAIQTRVYDFKQKAGVPYNLETALGYIGMAGLGSALLEGLGHGIVKAYKASVKRGEIVETPETKAATEKIEELQEIVDAVAVQQSRQTDSNLQTQQADYDFFIKNELVSETDKLAISKPIQPTQEALDKVRQQGLPDKFASPFYRDSIEIMARDLTPGGGVFYTTDAHNRITGRSKSLNPKWFQNNEDMASVKYVLDVVSNALEGKKLGAKQVRVIKALMDEWDDIGRSMDGSFGTYSGSKTPLKGEFYNESGVVMYPYGINSIATLPELEEIASYRSINEKKLDELYSIASSDKEYARLLNEEIESSFKTGTKNAERSDYQGSPGKKSTKKHAVDEKSALNNGRRTIGTAELNTRLQRLAKAEADLMAGRPVQGDETIQAIEEPTATNWDEYQQQTQGSPATFKLAEEKGLVSKVKGLFKKDEPQKPTDEVDVDIAQAEASLADDLDLPDIPDIDKYGNEVLVPAKVAMVKADREINAINSLLDCIK